MKTYVKTTGAVFALLVLLHLVRVYMEGLHVLQDPAFAISTLIAVGLTTWSWRVLKAAKEPD